MAKKNISNVVISDEELTPTTLGVYSNKTKSPIFIFLIIIVFLAIAFFLPNIQGYLDKLTGKATSSNINNNEPNNPDTPDNPNNPDTPDKPTTPDTPADDKYAFASDVTVENNYFTITNISVSNNVLQLDINAKREVDLDVYYLEVFDDSDTLLGRIKLSEEELNSNQSKSYTYKFLSGGTKFRLVTRTENDYPDVSLSYDENNIASLTCSNDSGEKFIYEFTADQLIKVIYSYQLSRNVENYYDEMRKYIDMDNKYKLIDAATSSMISSENGFDYTLNLDLNNASEDDLSKITIRGFYKLKSSAGQVKFKIESSGYTCN